eukprot:Anaeramoba_ignava/c20462_g2_i2.p1 GENE.c20462_g2_i2~~c20462_g2_i2.p1  ORF type:complete len:861 (-),score=324.62 c20462_g2_i2:414-2996(-)
MLEPLVESVLENLTHPVPYTRKNAVLAVSSIYKVENNFIPDAPLLLLKFLKNETDPSCQRNAFIMLYEIAPEKAFHYLFSVLDRIETFDESIQLIAIEIINKIYLKKPSARSKYLKCITSLLQSSSTSVKFESAKTLSMLSNSSTAIKASAQTFCTVLRLETDNNVRLIVLKQLEKLRLAYPALVSDVLLDLFQVFSNSSLDIKKQILNISEDLVSLKNVDQVVLFLKKEFGSIFDKKNDDGNRLDYVRLLINFVHQLTFKFTQIAPQIIEMLIDLIAKIPNDEKNNPIDEASLIIRDIIQAQEDIREKALLRLFEIFPQIQSSFTIRTIIWIFGEFCQTEPSIKKAFSFIENSLNELKQVAFKTQEEEKEKETEKETNNTNQENIKENTIQTKKQDSNIITKSSNTKILDDGSYAVIVESSNQPSKTTLSALKAQDIPLSNLTKLMIQDDSLLATVIAVSLSKLSLRYSLLPSQKNPNSFIVDSILLLISLLKISQSEKVIPVLDKDAEERIIMCIKILGQPDESIKKNFLKESPNKISDSLSSEKLNSQKNQQLHNLFQEKNQPKESNPDDIVLFPQLTKFKSHSNLVADDTEEDLKKIIDFSDENSNSEEVDFFSSLNQNRSQKILQLTGLSDPIYVEAILDLNQYNISLIFYVKNQTKNTLQNLTLELLALGGLKLIEKPPVCVLGSFAEKQILVNLKVSSSEKGIIFGNITYDISGTSTTQKTMVILNEIKISPLEYLIPSYISLFNFRRMWSDFEWENKLVISTHFSDIETYINSVAQKTNMKCLAPVSKEDQVSGFVSKNFYAKTIFGEDVVANVSLEQSLDNKISALIRIRTRSQGLALALGDLLNNPNLDN